MVGMAARPKKSPTTLTIRNVSPELRRLLAARARERKLSLSRATLDVLMEVFPVPRGPMPPGPPYHDLDFTIGTWSKEEADEFDGFLAEQRRV
jgi:hypothetical protein